MGFRIGYHGDQRQELHDGVAHLCTLLGAECCLIPPTPIDAVDVLLWNYTPPLDAGAETLVRHHPNVFLLPERGWMPSGTTTSFRRDMLDYCVVPFDPEELALRIVRSSWRRNQMLAYDFDPAFYATYQQSIDACRMLPQD